VSWTTDMATARQYQVQYRALGDSDWIDHDLATEGALRQGYGYVYSNFDGLYAATVYEMQYCYGGLCSANTWLLGTGTLATQAEPNVPAVINHTTNLAVSENVDPSDLERNMVGWVYGHSGRGDRYGQNELRYWLEGQGAENFTVELFRGSSYGIVRATAALDHETTASFTLTLHVSDGRNANGAKDLSSDDSTRITITVTDVVERPGSPLLVQGATESDSIQLSWGIPDAGDQTITGYYVQYRQAGSSRWYHSSRITGTETTISRLQPATSYEFRGITVAEPHNAYTWSDRDMAPMLVAATEAATDGQSASEARSTDEPQTASAKSPAAPASPPAAPRNLTAQSTAESVTLSWDASDDASITGYQVLRKQFGCGCQLQVHVENTGSSATAFTDTAVEPGTRYVYRVKAINAAGVSDQSNYVRINAD